MDRGRRTGIEVITTSTAETMEWGKQFGKTLQKNSVIALFGELGAGKTTLIKGIVGGALGIDVEEVASPTFVYLNIYSANGLSLYHFDLYRLSGPSQFLASGFEEYFFASGITCIEWSERIATILPEERVEIHLRAEEGEKRVINYAQNRI